MDKAVSEYPVFPADLEARAVPWDSLSKTGVFGDATKASREKGRMMLDAVVAKAVELIESFRKGIQKAP